MKEVTGMKVELLHRGVLIIFETKEGSVPLKFSKSVARTLMRAVYLKIGTKTDGPPED